MDRDQISILCVDDHAVVLHGIALVINLHHDMTVVASTTEGEAAIDLFRKHRPDITLLDLRLGKMDGVDVIKRIRQEFPAARFVVLTMYAGDQDLHRAMAAGADAYLLKDAQSDELVRVIREVYAGRAAAPRIAASRATYAALTKREQEVLQLIAEGIRNRQIAAALHISEETVHTHLKNIYEKLRVQDRTQAVTVAIRRGIVHVR